jgi:hypothetical protein
MGGRLAPGTDRLAATDPPVPAENARTATLRDEIPPAPPALPDRAGPSRAWLATPKRAQRTRTRRRAYVPSSVSGCDRPAACAAGPGSWLAPFPQKRSSRAVGVRQRMRRGSSSAFRREASRRGTTDIRRRGALTNGQSVCGRTTVAEEPPARPGHREGAWRTSVVAPPRPGAAIRADRHLHRPVAADGTCRGRLARSLSSGGRKGSRMSPQCGTHRRATGRCSECGAATRYRDGRCRRCRPRRCECFLADLEPGEAQCPACRALASALHSLAGPGPRPPAGDLKRRIDWFAGRAAARLALFPVPGPDCGKRESAA